MIKSFNTHSLDKNCLILGPREGLVMRKDTSINRIRSTSPESPGSMIFNLAARVWVNYNTVPSSMLGEPYSELLIVFGK